MQVGNFILHLLGRGGVGEWGGVGGYMHINPHFTRSCQFSSDAVCVPQLFPMWKILGWEKLDISPQVPMWSEEAPHSECIQYFFLYFLPSVLFHPPPSSSPPSSSFSSSCTSGWSWPNLPS